MIDRATAPPDKAAMNVRPAFIVLCWLSAIAVHVQTASAQLADRLYFSMSAGANLLPKLQLRSEPTSVSCDPGMRGDFALGYQLADTDSFIVDAEIETGG